MVLNSWVIVPSLATCSRYPENVVPEMEEFFHLSNEECEEYKRLCPISIIDLAFDLFHQFVQSIQ